MTNMTKQEHQLYMKALVLTESDRPAFFKQLEVDDDLQSRVGDRLEALKKVDVGLAWFEPTVFGDGHFGPYRFIEALGHGGMGRVYLAEQQEPIKRQVAIKIMDTVPEESDEQKFLQESQWLASLNHPFIAKLYEVNHLGEHPYFAMEYVPGKSITDFCRQRRQSLRARLQLFIHVCEAIQHAHDRGVIHRDLKPSNILVYEEQGKAIPKIIDFGIATLTQRFPEGEREPFWGTPDWLAPELRRQMQDPSPRYQPSAVSDVYSLGLILFQLVTGLTHERGSMAWASSAFNRQPMSAQKKLAQALRTSPRKLNRQLTFGLDAILDKALATQPEDRYASAVDLAEDLQQFLTRGFPDAETQHRWEPAYRWWQRRKKALVLGSVWGVFALFGCAMVYQLFLHRHQVSLVEKKAQSSSDTLEAVISSMSPDLQTNGPSTLPTLFQRAERAMDQQMADSETLDSAYLDLAEVYVDSGIYEGAERLLKKAGENPTIKQDPEFHAKYQLMRAYLHYNRGEFQLANHYLQHLEQFLSAYEMDSEVTYQIQGVRKMVFAIMGDVDKAHYYEKRQQEVLGKGVQLPKSERLELETLLYSHFGLGDLGNLEDAKEWVEMDRPDATMLDRLGYLGFQILWQLDSNDADGALESAYLLQAQMASAFGKAHPAYAESLYYLGVVHTALGLVAKAENHLHGALEIQINMLGIRHPETWNTLVALGELAFSNGEFGLAQAHFQSVLDHVEKAQGPRSAAALRSHLGLLAVHKERDRADLQASETGWLTHFFESLPADIRATLPPSATYVNIPAGGRITSGARFCSR